MCSLNAAKKRKAYEPAVGRRNGITLCRLYQKPAAESECGRDTVNHKGYGQNREIQRFLQKCFQVAKNRRANSASSAMNTSSNAYLCGSLLVESFSTFSAGCDLMYARHFLHMQPDLKGIQLLSAFLHRLHFVFIQSHPDSFDTKISHRHLLTYNMYIDDNTIYRKASSDFFSNVRIRSLNVIIKSTV